MKKLTAIILSFTLILVPTACGDGSARENGASDGEGEVKQQDFAPLRDMAISFKVVEQPEDGLRIYSVDITARPSAG